MRARTLFNVYREPWFEDRIGIGIALKGPDYLDILEPLKFRRVSHDALAIEHEPALRVDPDEAQRLMDELWRVGIRPIEGHGSAGQIGATERHLEDMRRLVFMASGWDRATPENKK